MSPSDSPLSCVTMVPTSGSAWASIHRPEVEIAGRATRVLVDQVRSIDPDYLVGDFVDYLTRDQLSEVKLVLGHYLGVHAPIRFDPRR